MDHRVIFDPLAVLELGRSEGRPPQDARPLIDGSIPVANTEPGMEFGRRYMTCEYFLRHFIKYYVARQIQNLPPNTLTPNCFADGRHRRAFQVFMQHLPRCVFHDPACMNDDTLLDTPFFSNDNEVFFHRHSRPYLGTMLRRPDVDASYPWRQMRDVPMDLFVSCQWDLFVSDHRRWVRDADTMNRSHNRQGFYIGGHVMHFWKLASVQRGHGPLFVPCAAPVYADAALVDKKIGTILIFCGAHFSISLRTNTAQCMMANIYFF